MSTETDQLQAVIENRDQASSVVTARAELQKFYIAATLAKTEIDAIIAGGSFNLIPTELKVKLLAINSILTSAGNALASHADFLNWRP